MDFSAITALLLCVALGGIFLAPTRGSARKH